MKGNVSVSLLSPHCRLHERVVIVKNDKVQHVEQKYTLQRHGARTGSDQFVFPRQLPALTLSLGLPKGAYKSHFSRQIDFGLVNSPSASTFPSWELETNRAYSTDALLDE